MQIPTELHLVCYSTLYSCDYKFLNEVLFTFFPPLYLYFLSAALQQWLHGIPHWFTDGENNGPGLHTVCGHSYFSSTSRAPLRGLTTQKHNWETEIESP